MLNRIKAAVLITLTALALCVSLCSCKETATQEGLVSDLRQGVEDAGDELHEGIERANDFLE